MIRIDLQQLTADVQARLQDDAAGTAVRALLAAGGSDSAASIIPFERLERPRPTPPFLALQATGAPSLPGGPHQATFVWWVYDTPEQGYWRIRGILRPLARAYAGFRSTAAPVSDVDAVAGEGRLDKALNLLVLPVTLTLYC